MVSSSFDPAEFLKPVSNELSQIVKSVVYCYNPTFEPGEPRTSLFKNSHRTSGEQQVLLFDPQIASGAAALMAVSVLKDHGVKEEKIVFVTYIASPVGLWNGRLNAVFPQLRIVVAEVDGSWTKRWVDQVFTLVVSQ